MNSYKTVKTVLRKHLEEWERDPTDFISRYHDQVHETLFNWIADLKTPPKRIIHLLDSYLSGLDGFSNSWFKNMVAITCLDGLAKRRPKVFVGQWEKVAWVITKYTTSLRNVCGIIFIFQEPNMSTLKWILEFGSPILCPNPCLRLELFGAMRCLVNFARKSEYPYDWESFRESVICTICEVHNEYQSLTVEQLPMFTACDLKDLTLSNGIGLKDPFLWTLTESKRIEIIACLVKVTGMFALLEKERHQRDPERTYTALKDSKLKDSLYRACLCFCGLLPEYFKADPDTELNSFMSSFDNIVSKNPLLHKYMVDALNAITNANLALPEDEDRHLNMSVTDKREYMNFLFFKNKDKLLPMHQHLREIHGGFSPAALNRLRYVYDIFENSRLSAFALNFSMSGTYDSDEEHNSYASDEEHNSCDSDEEHNSYGSEEDRNNDDSEEENSYLSSEDENDDHSSEDGENECVLQ
ncbi:unnamed protein product [Meganyctiphanes norvegica]|uniref:Uncharacterized protein n=1 Tax=Meganyctiphanes norvegica TaxID=48144 RepID=A0AAV2QEF8_MEGNR